jgi:hypothetical protein
MCGQHSHSFNCDHTLCTINKLGMRFDAITVDSDKTTIIWNLMPCSLVDRYQGFRETFRIHVQSIRVRIKVAVLSQRRYLSAKLYILSEV